MILYTNDRSILWVNCWHISPTQPYEVYNIRAVSSKSEAVGPRRRNWGTLGWMRFSGGEMTARVG
jgi:hypothetical protein